MRNDNFSRALARIMGGDSSSGRTDLSRRTEQRQIDQRVRRGDLRPGQRSLNEFPSFD